MTNEEEMTNDFARIVLVQLNTDEQLNVREHEAIRVAIKALEQQTCVDAISREAVLDITWEEPSYTDALNVLTEVRDKVKALPPVNPAEKQELCDDTISRRAVKDKLLKLCNELEGIFANIRMENQDESVCGLCEYDCPAPYECPGFYKEDCFKLADEIRHKWQSTKDLPPVNPQHTDDEIQKMQDLEQAEIQKAYELGKTEGQKTGHWKEYNKPYDIDGTYYCYCDNCGGDAHEKTDFCPNCGARMVEPQESEDKEDVE